jgi:hypothetical protein
MSQNDQRIYRSIYRSFEEFEREELRRSESVGSVEEMVASLFDEELELDRPARPRRKLDRDDDE